ncbi:deoxyribodipyrimidine photo-lyase [Bosea sp. (in: a-proteobacteria)]|uniref:cryptochrome/photolyase family protein n=1 Tax=Bosea sp. (in: a-proteobacteria) TaxID=1871050 RepID=UPI0026019540|nr:deoxyribodipyrimidine photo-lyase [Bosea sp. (in: a-proteobacteria)]MCO5089868.1 DNA photolyase family protein [Bosea sp. (in: a-proteobacteria)]
MATEVLRSDLERPVIVWLRDDLRLSDNPALTAAANCGRRIICAFVHDEESEGVRPLGGAARWWLHGALREMDDALRGLGGRLCVHRGVASVVIPQLAADSEAAAVYWNRRYGAAERHVDEAVKTTLKAQRIEARSFNGHLLYEPWSIKTGSGTPFRVFSAFWRAAHGVGEPGQPLGVPARLNLFHGPCGQASTTGVELADLALEPTSPDWAGGLRSNWRRGEAGAQARLEFFLNEHLHEYADLRDFPDRSATSRLSPYLRFGNISPRQLWHAAEAAANATTSLRVHQNLEKFRSELGWREFSYHLLYHNPEIATQNLQSKFDQMPWRSDADALRAWQQGKTGYPIIDAGMRELWTTGWMHNRVRMVVASFLVKHLLIDWRQGEAWFWDTLVDADPANNAASWQWVAGSGADAAPYFRVFNPVLQGEKFDPDGRYVKRWLPELDGVSSSVVHRPWQLGNNVEAYAERIVEHGLARQRALDAFKGLG